jgi:signal peptidase I
MNQEPSKDNQSPPPSSGFFRNLWGPFLENVPSLVVAIFLILVIRSSAFEAFKIPSGSMIPTLLVGDYIFVNKMSYGIKVPFTEWIFERPWFITEPKAAQRGDIIVFKFPKDESIYYIKRVIGIPGDTIEVRNKVVFVNGSPVPRKALHSELEAKIRSEIDSRKYPLDYLEIFEEHFYDHDFTMMVDESHYATSEFGPIQIPKDRYFVMGDNRDHSYDSRFWGFVPFHSIKGRAVVIWLSLWLDFSNEEYYFRPSRIGQSL